MNRDGLYWKLGAIGAALTAISSRLDALDLLLPPQHAEKVHAIIEITSVVIVGVCGWMMTSPLPGKHDADRIQVRRDVDRDRDLPPGE